MREMKRTQSGGLWRGRWYEDFGWSLGVVNEWEEAERVRCEVQVNDGKLIWIWEVGGIVCTGVNSRGAEAPVDRCGAVPPPVWTRRLRCSWFQCERGIMLPPWYLSMLQASCPLTDEFREGLPRSHLPWRLSQIIFFRDYPGTSLKCLAIFALKEKEWKTPEARCLGKNLCFHLDWLQFHLDWLPSFN